MNVVAFVDDLMDRSRVSAAIPGVRFVRDPSAVGDADVAVVDLARYAEVVRALRESSTAIRIIAFGPHVDEDAHESADRDGADLVLPRSRFFRDPKQAIAV